MECFTHLLTQTALRVQTSTEDDYSIHKTQSARSKMYHPPFMQLNVTAGAGLP